MRLEEIVLVVYCASLLIMSIYSYFEYKKDKKLAEKNKERVSEKRLLKGCVLGGALGSLVGRKVFHHKTDKMYFSITIYFCFLLQIVGLALLIYSVLI